MGWKRRMKRQFLVALLGGGAVTAVYWALGFTRGYHGVAHAALMPAIDIVWHHLDPNCYMRSYCELEVLAANVGLYTFWIFIALLGIDVVRRLMRKPVS